MSMMDTIHNRHCIAIAALVQLLLVQVRDAESEEARDGGFMFSPVHCDALKSINTLLGDCIEVLDSSYGPDRKEEPVMVLAEMLRYGVDAMLGVAQRSGEEQRERLNELIRKFNRIVGDFEVLEKRRIELYTR
jgi:hypothetical protein